ncbi:hypothetical protein R6Q57_014466, partial [Mikania cordata]
FVKSRNNKQLRDPKAENDTRNCFPESLDEDNKPIVPCGLIAWSLFNDTYKLSTKGGKQMISIHKKGISWKSDREAKFGSNVYPKNFQKHGLRGGATLDHTIPLSEQEDLIVWMRTAALPKFRKLYGKITETDIEAHDTINVEIENNYNTYKFGGRKTLVLSTTTWIGGKNDFLGMAYICVGANSKPTLVSEPRLKGYFESFVRLKGEIKSVDETSHHSRQIRGLVNPVLLIEEQMRNQGTSRWLKTAGER